jgi:hypothetical protein
VAKVALRFGCAKQSKNLEWCLLMKYLYINSLLILKLFSSMLKKNVSDREKFKNLEAEGPKYYTNFNKISWINSLRKNKTGFDSTNNYKAVFSTHLNDITMVFKITSSLWTFGMFFTGLDLDKLQPCSLSKRPEKYHVLRLSLLSKHWAKVLVKA